MSLTARPHLKHLAAACIAAFAPHAALAASGEFTFVVGDVTLIYRSEAHGQGEVGWAIHPDHQGNGYATEASRAMLGLAFDGLGLHRVVARCDGRNTASVAVMERLGMRKEAHFVENEFVKGEWSDELVFAILRTEWAASHDVDLAVDTIN